MTTLCLGGPYDGRLVSFERPDFFIAVPADGDHFRQERYRREQFCWGEKKSIWFMWVYLHEFMSERVALDQLFGTRGALSERGDVP